MTDVGLILKAFTWFGIASLGMVPYFLALRRYRLLTANDRALGNASTRVLLDSPQSDPEWEATRHRTRRRLWIGLAIYFVCIPLLPVLLNT